jgi:glycosyltransferase involved in cell wall biosynthesis
MKGQAPRLSVIVPTYERPELLERAFSSLREQTFQDFELLLVDDASRDHGTPRKIAELVARDERVRGLRLERNGGPGSARNAAFPFCRGELVALLDDDDLADPERFARQVALLDGRPEIDWVATAVGWMTSDGNVFQVRPGLIRRGELPEDPAALFRLLALDGNYVPTSTVMVRRRALAGLRFLDGARAGEDWFLFLQLAARGHRLATIPEPLVKVLREPGHVSLMSDKARTFPDQRRVLRELGEWLERDGRGELAALLRPALAQQYLREARFWGGWRALALVLRASLLAPGAPRVGETWRWLAALYADKARRTLRLS